LEALNPPEIVDPAAFKDGYRRLLDHAPWSEAGRDAMVDEVHRAYAFNVEVFASLDHRAA
jgi:heme oxygenase